jgi:hypothetical protein
VCVAYQEESVGDCRSWSGDTRIRNGVQIGSLLPLGIASSACRPPRNDRWAAARSRCLGCWVTAAGSEHVGSMFEVTLQALHPRSYLAAGEIRWSLVRQGM